jgi:hypothetical protein
LSRATTAREALVVEAMADMSALIDRLEALAALLDTRHRLLADASAELGRRVEGAEQHMAALTEHAKTQAVRHIARRTEEMAKASLDTQRRAMAEAAQDLFRAEVAPALQRVTAPLQRLEGLANRGAHPWAHWLTHLATAATASAVAWALAAGLWCGRG